jgi:hypothetical protein
VPAEAQVQAVVAKLKKLNPGFDGKATHRLDQEVAVSRVSAPKGFVAVRV